MPTTISHRYKLRRGTAAAWTTADPVLLEGEPGLETDTRKVKYGDGVTAWTSLAYATISGVAWGDITGDIEDQADLLAVFDDIADELALKADLGSPQISDHDTYTFVLADANKHYYHTDAGAHTVTIPANSSIAFSIGTVLGFVNEDGAGDVTIAITTDTLRWQGNTGSRTLAENGFATAIKVTATLWRLTGDGIT